MNETQLTGGHAKWNVHFNDQTRCSTKKFNWIISRIENKGLKLVGGKLMQVPTELAEKHYSEHEGKPFYEKLFHL